MDHHISAPLQPVVCRTEPHHMVRFKGDDFSPWLRSTKEGVNIEPAPPSLPCTAALATAIVSALFQARSSPGERYLEMGVDIEQPSLSPHALVLVVSNSNKLLAASNSGKTMRIGSRSIRGIAIMLSQTRKNGWRREQKVLIDVRGEFVAYERVCICREWLFTFYLSNVRINEIMTGSVDTRSVVSRMTLALLEDSGWYRANYSMADHLEWGRNQGTEFFTSPCNQWKGAYHSNSTQFSGCTYNREPEGYCPIVSYNGDLPQWAQYFPQPKKGGQSSLADYCTYFLAYSDGSCTDINSARAPNMMLGEVRGSDSRCMASSLVRSGFVRGSTTQGNGCYQHRCLNNSLEFNGDCINGKCYCFLGFEGEDCSKRSCPNNCSGHGKCLEDGVCGYENGYTGIDCSTVVCDEHCSLHGGVCDNGVCEFPCSDYAGYSCLNTSTVIFPSLSVCREVLQAPGKKLCSGRPHLSFSVFTVLDATNNELWGPHGSLLADIANATRNSKFGSIQCVDSSMIPTLFLLFGKVTNL
ncbi:Unknown protein [Striga hermonthica]|uniref:EGF-like domain-containing protein n=1 Tax=Striga hermonthica TaxID=68872 RepID=A0A9N7RP15_STRHE|nr:Unknown protein [Striga hermonthica]